MGLFDKLFKKKIAAIEVETEKNTLYLPIEGEVIQLEKVDDAVFSQGILGPGFGIVPAEEVVYAPADAEVTTVAETKHALGILTDDGAEVLIHVGMDTVEMNGDGFDVLVSLGQKVRCGQPLIKFSIDKITKAGHPVTTAVVITNADDLPGINVTSYGKLPKLSPVLKVEG